MPALKDNGSLRKAVEDGICDRWALEISKKFDENKDGVEGTPSFVIDGKKLTDAEGKNGPMTVAGYNAAIDKAQAAGTAWRRPANGRPPADGLPLGRAGDRPSSSVVSASP